MNKSQYESWWDTNLGSDKYLHNGEWHPSPSISSFEQWMGDHTAPDRVLARSLMVPFDSFLDAGCGAAPEYQAINSDKYTGLDITEKLVNYNKSRGINCVLGSLNNIPFADNSFDVVISRHVVEHMSNIEQPLSELIRVAKKQILLYFFIQPVDSLTHNISLDNQNTQYEIYHNQYSKVLIESQLSNNAKVKDYKWINGCASTVCFLDIRV